MEPKRFAWAALQASCSANTCIFRLLHLVQGLKPSFLAVAQKQQYQRYQQMRTETVVILGVSS